MLLLLIKAHVILVQIPTMSSIPLNPTRRLLISLTKLKLLDRYYTVGSRVIEFHHHNYLIRLLDQLFVFSGDKPEAKSDTHRNQALVFISSAAPKSARMEEEVSSFSCYPHLPHHAGLKCPLRLYAKTNLYIP